MHAVSTYKQADPVSPVTLRQLMSHVLHFLHPMAAETALATVNTEVGLDYWLPGDPHQELQRVRHGGHLAARVLSFRIGLGFKTTNRS